MAGAVFLETLRRSWKQILYWGLGLSIYAAYPFLMLPDDVADMQSFEDMVGAFDEGMLRAFGISDATMLSTPEGLIGYSFFGFLLLIMSIYAAIAGLNVTANEEDSGIMNVMLSLPINRWQIVVEKLLAYTVMLFGICGFMWLGLMAGHQFASIELSLSGADYAEGILNVIPGTLLVMCFTAFVATVLKQRTFAIALAGVFVAVSYVIDMIGRAANSEVADAVREISIFSHYNGSEILIAGISAVSFLVIGVIALMLAGGAVVAFERREIIV